MNLQLSMSIFGSNETDSYQITYRISANELGGDFHSLKHYLKQKGEQFCFYAKVK